jgi:hypothetical protein
MKFSFVTKAVKVQRVYDDCEALTDLIDVRLSCSDDVVDAIETAFRAMKNGKIVLSVEGIE